MPSFTYPLALWALLGIPVVLAIHFLQRRSRRVTVTTLFLLQQLQRESEKGNRIEKLRFSVPLWLQLLMVLLLTWMLAGPQWLRNDAVHRIALVLDSSASMQAFRPAAEKAVSETLATLVPAGARAELTLLSTDVTAPSLYYGNSASELVATLSQWQPRLGTHEFTPALRSARSLTGPQGAVLLITDHPLPTAPAFGAKVLSIGQETANVGWAGVTLETPESGPTLWRALVRNYSTSPQTGDWWAETEGQASTPISLTLAPGETRTLSAPFLEGAPSLTLHLTKDAFTLDDHLPLVHSRPKLLSLHLPVAKEEATRELVDLFGRFADTVIQKQASQADVQVIMWPPSLALEATQHACLFSTPSKVANPPALRGMIVAEVHPLTEGLNWQSLLAREGMVMPRDSRDRVLLWQGERPLISLRETPAGARQLFCHFDLANSNARKLPAMAVLLHRFLEMIRQEKIAPETTNYDLRQRLTVAHQRGEMAAPLILKTSNGLTESVAPHQAHLLRAPAMPCHFTLTQGESPLLNAAAHFADTREADLSAAKPYDERAQLEMEQVATLQESDPRWRLWTLVLLAALLGSWWWGREKVAVSPAFKPHLNQV
ncbi:vWA domain-containing protein [Prosthecobacter dejongeii]|uniref:Aerotolerance regulator N-terminal domain-containing protein n=1 Tax=Prosthecobacter dejongeii TaxID=48465 RepID=A0A7W8DMS3_9BACT|nr:VWA domain-containing protein [Prosthecobacter dejongeii]MBB5035779.1 hypothetical protein [Prosthecobacter dejongeii]